MATHRINLLARCEADECNAAAGGKVTVDYRTTYFCDRHLSEYVDASLAVSA